MWIELILFTVPRDLANFSFTGNWFLNKPQSCYCVTLAAIQTSNFGFLYAPSSICRIISSTSVYFCEKRSVKQRSSEKMGVDDVPLDDKAKRMRDLLSSFYSPDHAMSSSNSSKFASLDAINTISFDADQYMNLLARPCSFLSHLIEFYLVLFLRFETWKHGELQVCLLISIIWWSRVLIDRLVQVRKSNLEGLLQKHVEMAAEIKNLDTDLQMLVYENYNKFISATETIKRYCFPFFVFFFSFFFLNHCWQLYYSWTFGFVLFDIAKCEGTILSFQNIW